MNPPALRIGLAGLGTVGARVAQILTERADMLTERVGRPLILSAVSARDQRRWRGVDLSAVPWCKNPTELAERDDVDVVVELIGGADGVPFELVASALKHGKHVVTGNKALIAHHGGELAALAEDAGVALGYEAAVAGGIPVIKTLQEALVADRIKKVYGILNGTCNFILSKMAETGQGFDDVLRQAQKLGYAEANSTFDVEGTDAAHKLSILSALAFGTRIDFAGVACEGITQIGPLDFEFARELGYAIRLLAVAEWTEAGVRQHVHPAMVPLGTPMADVLGPFNAVVIECEPLGTLVLEGPGAGAGPTASSVLSDIADIAKGSCRPAFIRPVARLRAGASVPLDEREGSFYLRLSVLDRPGVIAEVAGILARHDISIESMIQRGRDPGAPVQVVIITHDTREAAMQQALQGLTQATNVVEAPCMIRIEAF